MKVIHKELQPVNIPQISDATALQKNVQHEIKPGVTVPASWIGLPLPRAHCVLGKMGACFRDSLGHGRPAQKWKLKLRELWGLAQATQGANGQAYWSAGCFHSSPESDLSATSHFWAF